MGLLTCKGCGKSSTGEVCSRRIDEAGRCMKQLWSVGGDRFYWSDDSNIIVCEDCIRTALNQLGLELLNVDEVDDDSSRRTMH
jgi:hypothetical protein